MDREARLADLEERVVGCTRCPRLVEHRERVAAEKRRAYQDWDYWGKPVPGFGDPQAELVIVGLAPAGHGGNRTGRVFTGDPSAAFLMAGLHAVGFANQPTSEHRGDGLELHNAYITAAVRCVPPDNRPRAAERDNCGPYLHEEMEILRPRALLALGHLAFDAATRYLEARFDVPRRDLEFGHGAVYEFDGGAPALFVSYHPSPRNTYTGLLTEEAFREVLRRVREYLER